MTNILIVATLLFPMAAPDEDQRFIKPFISHKSAKSLAIPLAFNEYFPDPLPNTVELLDYYGRSWTIRMKKRGETVFLTVGWENFVKDNELEDGKMMEFIYDCDRTFMLSYLVMAGLASLESFLKP
ncbi:hypothetical protein Bca52824_062997 [Brassica carinata]|uniref:TF-B3 domain-containing protein n=1 Tax=Brassica carinata TaxID=52824 RepID=A0A8X7U7A0_BRACI|nr:hypothetical protein Bca52824_062997 [Brassica carinata]